ncbi:unnamed protein product [Ectocarpus sp. CCAP 1310/34]|nr:unnamed protein product [Ectocarpus sp. CCAP 1310/34]
MMCRLQKQSQPPRATSVPRETKKWVTPVKKAKPAKQCTLKTVIMTKVPVARKQSTKMPTRASRMDAANARCSGWSWFLYETC